MEGTIKLMRSSPTFVSRCSCSCATNPQAQFFSTLCLILAIIYNTYLKTILFGKFLLWQCIMRNSYELYIHSYAILEHHFLFSGSSK